MVKVSTKDTDVVILCGGLGTRLSGVINDRPKSMVEINSRPFLTLLIDYLTPFGFTRFILCTGYKAAFIEEYYRDREDSLVFVFSEEERPLGTAGAIKNAEPVIQSETFLVLNGDSFCQIDMEAFLDFHLRKGALASLALTTMEEPADYGVIKLSEDRIVGFKEKMSVNGLGLINAGIYAFEKTILAEISPGQKLSLEYDTFPSLLDKGIYGYRTRARLFDIGTPERLKTAREFLKQTQ